MVLVGGGKDDGCVMSLDRSEGDPGSLSIPQRLRRS